MEEDNELGVDDVILCSRALQTARHSNFAQTTKMAPRYWPVTHMWEALPAISIAGPDEYLTMGPNLTRDADPFISLYVSCPAQSEDPDSSPSRSPIQSAAVRVTGLEI